MKAARTLAAHAAKHKHVPKKCLRGIASPIASPFNAREVVAAPSFGLSRPTAKGEIEFDVHAHEVAPRQWIAQSSWIWREGSMPMDAAPLDNTLPRFESRSEAVDDAISRAMRDISEQRVRPAERAPWALKSESLRAWTVDAIFQTRGEDAGLALHKRTIIDVFAGSGGLSMGLTSLGGSVTLAVENDPEALATYRANVRPKATHGDVCTLDGKGLSCDILTMGLLCQAFSAAGKGLGFADPKLAEPYRHALRLLGEIDAKVVVIECARQLMTNGSGKDAQTVIDALLEAGYRVRHRTLNSAGFGLPQSRERSFIVATRVGLDAGAILGFMFPEESEPTAAVEDVMDAGLPATIPASDIVATAPAAATRQKRLVKVGEIDGRDSQGYRVYDPKGLGPTLTTSGGGKARFSGAYAVPGGARALSSREACRMQGIPDWASHHPNWKNAMGQAGNAVAVSVARELGRQISRVMPRSA